MSHIHIPDGVLPTWLWVAGWLVTLAAVWLAGRSEDRGDRRRAVPLISVVSALMMVAMSAEIVPLAYHVNLAVLGGILLGPVASIVAAFVVEVVLAMLGHGGVTVLGLNTVMIGAEMVVGGLMFAMWVRLLGRRRATASAALATVLTLAFTTTLAVGIVALAGGAELEHEELVGVGRFAAFVYTLGPLGWLLEAVVTAGIVRSLVRARPGILWKDQAEERSGPPGDESMH